MLRRARNFWRQSTCEGFRATAVPAPEQSYCGGCSTRPVQQPPEEARALAHGRDVTAQPRIEPKASSGGMQSEHEHDDREEYVRPGPLRRVAGAIHAEPQMQHEHDCKRAHQTHAKPEDERDCKCELRKKDDGVEDVKIRQIEFRYEPA